jgi:predicted lipoprotein with Yx(FWY)xxD motif
MRRRHTLLATVLLITVTAGPGLFAGSGLWAAAQSSDATTGATTVQVAHDATYGDYLTDGKGMALYIAAEPGQVDRINGSGDPPVAACTGTCLQVWPPLTTDGAPVAGDGVKADLLGTTEDPNGGTQVTYAGWPLYTFAADTSSGSTFGQAVAPPQGAATGAAWYLMAPDGTVILTTPPD